MEQQAKALRKNSTEAEKWLWRRLRNRELAGWKFRRQHPIGPFIVDFVCIEKKLIIEVDGGQHAETIEWDSKRFEYLKEQGYRVLRFWNDEVLKERDATLNVILSYLSEEAPSPPPSPPKSGGEGVRE